MLAAPCLLQGVLTCADLSQRLHLARAFAPAAVSAARDAAAATAAAAAAADAPGSGSEKAAKMLESAMAACSAALLLDAAACEVPDVTKPQEVRSSLAFAAVVNVVFPLKHALAAHMPVDTVL